MSDVAGSANIAALAITAYSLETHVDSVTDLFFGHTRETCAANDESSLVTRINSWRQAVIRISTREVTAVAGDEAEVEHRVIKLRDITKVGITKCETYAGRLKYHIAGKPIKAAGAAIACGR